MSKILITGTAGFIGFHIADRLLKEGWNIVGLDNINDYYDVNLKFGRLREAGIYRNKIKYNRLIQSAKYATYRFVKLNLHDRENILALFKREKFEYVVHLAAQAGVRYSLQNPYLYVDSNIYGFLNILEACRHFPVNHLVYASSSSVYGSNTKLPFSVKDNVDHPISLYAATKKSNELMAYTYSHLFKIPTTGLRFFTVYGPWGRPDMALFLFTKAILEGKEIPVYNNGDMKRDFTYISDIVEGIYRLIKTINISSSAIDSKTDFQCSSALYRIFNIGNNKPVQLLDFIRLIEKKLGKKANMKFYPLQPGDVPVTYAEIDDLMSEIQFKPITEVSTGINKFIDWYVDYYNIPK